VCAGWWALYQTRLKQLDSDPKAQNMSPEQIEQEAIVYADELTMETQPDLHALEVSPMFRDKGLGQLFLRFAQPLNVVWQNLTYDTFVSKEKTFGGNVARITAMGISALAVAAMRGAIWKPDDGDDDKKLLVMRRIFYYTLLSNYFDSVPLISDLVSNSIGSMITGEKTYRSNTYFQFAQYLLNIPGDITEGNAIKAWTDAFRAVGLGTGLPVSELTRLIKAWQNKAPWEIFGFDYDPTKKDK
jgi:hypothetical protein